MVEERANVEWLPFGGFFIWFIFFIIIICAIFPFFFRPFCRPFI